MSSVGRHLYALLAPGLAAKAAAAEKRAPAFFIFASVSTGFRNLELTFERADAMGLRGEDFDYAVTERALDADAGDVNDGDEAAIPPGVLAGFSAMLGVFIDTVIPPEGGCPHPQAIGV